METSIFEPAVMAFAALMSGVIIRTVIAGMLQWVIGSDILHDPHVIIGLPISIMMMINDTKLGVATIIGIFLIEWVTFLGMLLSVSMKTKKA